uniref:Uncharacterized protein n=1 Tax=Cannabis sativa TaxID=3483 RepID=A0A803Q8W5_CANSA
MGEDFELLACGLERGDDATEMVNAFCTMSPTETQGLGDNLFPEEAETATNAEVVDGSEKVAKDLNAHTPYFLFIKTLFERYMVTQLLPRLEPWLHTHKKVSRG